MSDARRVAIWRNGTAVAVPADQPVVTAFDAGLARGDGVFESVAVLGGRTPYLADHLARLARSAAILQIAEPGEQAWRALADSALADWDAATEGVLRLFLTRGEGAAPTALALLAAVPAEVLSQRERGIGVVTLSLGVPADFPSSAPWLLGGAKTLSYAVNMAALRHAQRLGADDVVHTSLEGQLLEGPTSTVVWATDGELRTPPTDTGILAGTTQARLFARAAEAGWPTRIVAGTVGDLHAADAVWLVSGIRGAARVHTLDGRSLVDGARGDGDLTRRVRTLLSR